MPQKSALTATWDETEESESESNIYQSDEEQGSIKILMASITDIVPQIEPIAKITGDIDDHESFNTENDSLSDDEDEDEGL